MKREVDTIDVKHFTIGDALDIHLKAKAMLQYGNRAVCTEVVLMTFTFFHGSMYTFAGAQYKPLLVNSMSFITQVLTP